MRKIIFCVVSLLLTIGFLFAGGCAEEKERTAETFRVIADFEDYNEAQQYAYGGGIQRVDIVGGEPYVAHGEGAAKLEVYAKEGYEPSVAVYSRTSLFDFQSFENVDLLSLSVYNGREENAAVTIRITTFNNSAQRKTYSLQEQTVKGGESSELDFVLDRKTLSLFVDIGYVESVDILFEKPDGEDADIYYVDALTVHYTEKTYEKVQKTFEENEILFFNEPTDALFVQPFSFCSETCYPGIRLNTDVKYAQSGGSLQITPVRSAHAVAGNSFSGVEISQSVLSQIDFTQLYPSATPNGAIEMKIYYRCQTTSSRRLFFRAYDTGIGSVNLYADVNPNEWTTVTLTYDDLTSQNLSLKNVNRFMILYDEICNEQTADFVLYVDDIRLVR